MTFEEFKQSTILSPVSQLADLFLLAGDIHATLYTGSKAMHSQILSIFNEEAGKFKQFSAAQNMKITLQRRYKNAVVDSSRQKQLEMFLGLRLFKHLPSISVQPLNVPSRPSGFFLKPVANMFPSGSCLLSFKRKDLIWVCPQATDVVELFIYLGEPCHACQLLLTVCHGADDSTYPLTIDVRTGRYLDGLKLVVEGATIPRCSNGTNLLIPLPGPISAEDMAITGAGSRLHAQDTNILPLLYEFEELEGELDFLTRIVAVTFYPAVSGRSPMTLGEIEVLGVSLPWDGVYNNDGSGARIAELAKKDLTETNPFSSSSENNPFSGTSLSNENVTPSMQQSASADWLDLLTGGDEFSEPLSHPLAQSNVQEGGDLLNFLDQAVTEYHGAETNHKFSSSQDGKPPESSAEKYINCLKTLAGPKMTRRLDFAEAMKLEIERLRLNLSAAERDRALLSIGIDPATINPNALIDESYMGRLCRVANTLALLGQASVEDKINAAIGLGTIDVNVRDFWNINGIGDHCYGGMCEVRAETKAPPHPSSVGASQSVLLCSECERKVCKICCAGRGALLLVSSNSRDNGLVSQDGSSHGSQVDSSTSRSVSLDDVICKRCCHDIILDALILDHLRVLISLRRRDRADSAAFKALNQVIGSTLRGCIHEKSQASDAERAAKVQKLLSGDKSLAEFPLASFLHSVETATDSPPFFTLLAPLEFGSWHSYWKAPPSTNSVEFVIVLGTLSDASGVILLVSPCGYSATDTPTVQIWAGNKIHKEERSCIGKWDVQSLVPSSSEIYGPEKQGRDDKVPRHVKFSFKASVRCRIIWMTLRLQRPGSSSVNFERDFNLLSFDENPFAQVNRRASFGGSTDSDPCLHAKRILVVGTPVKKEMGLSSQGPDETILNSWLERAPQLGRFKVPIEYERLMENDLVLEQYLPPASPSLAGFRLDAFTAIKPRVTHSPSSTEDTWDTSVTFLEDRHIFPAVLYIQVSAFQEPHNMVTIGEYRLPEAKGGTAMYFDFPRQIQTQKVTFRLLGDVTAFADDPAEQGDSGLTPLASGLSLSNRIKLYYRADPYELGTWASLSSV